MELLVGLIAELLLVAMAPIVAICAAVAGAVVEFIAGLLGITIAVRKEKAQSPPSAEKAPPQPKPVHIPWRGWRILRYVSLGVVLTIVSGGYLLNRYYFEPTVRWIANAAASRAGYVIELDVVEGDLLQGLLEIDGLRLVGQSVDGQDVSASVGQIEIDVAVLSLLTFNVRLDRLVVADVDVMVQRVASDDALAESAPKEHGGRRFTVELLDVTNAVMVVEQPDGARHELEIETAQVAPLRSNWAPFDLLFRSNLEASFDGADLRVQTEVIAGDGRRTEWALDRMEITTLSAFTDAAPIRWFADGTISAQMQDEWRRDDISIDTGWEIRLRDAEVGMGNVRGVGEAVLARALAEVVEAQRGDAEFAFRLQLDEDGFRDSASGDLTAWWNAMIRGLAQAVAAIEPTGTADEAEGRLRGFTQGVRDVLGIERDDN